MCAFLTLRPLQRFMDMTTQNFEKSAEFDAAMHAFSEIADRHGLQLTTQQKKIFWSGVLYGVRRARGQRLSRVERDRRPKPGQQNIGTAGLLDRPTEPDLHQGGAFQL